VLLDPEITKLALDRCLVESKVEPLLHSRVIGVELDNEKVRSIECVNHNGKFVIHASAFVDASGEADLTALAGGTVRVGDHMGQFQSATLMVRIGGVPLDADIHPLSVNEAIKRAKASGIQPLTKELGTIIRMPGSNDVLTILADESVNGLDSWDLTRAEISARAQAWAYMEAFKKYLSGFENAYLVQTGPQIGIRETRHIVGEYSLTGEDVMKGRRQRDAIARGGWPVELHTKPGEPNEWHRIADDSFYDIPLRSLKVNDLKNVWAGGRIIDCDYMAFASARVMGTAFATGHAAGIAAAIYVEKGIAESDMVRKELLKQGAIV
jgi:hypothetical protein